MDVLERADRMELTECVKNNFCEDNFFLILPSFLKNLFVNNVEQTVCIVVLYNII